MAHNSGARPDGYTESPCSGHDARDHMDAFDRLPEKIRRAVSTSELQFCPVTVAALVRQQGAVLTLETITAMTAQNHQQYLDKLPARPK